MKKCAQQQPNARVRLHSPNNGWRRHLDHTFNIRGDTDFDLFAGVIIETLKGLGYSGPNATPLLIGFFADVVNRLPVDVRKTIAVAILEGWGTEVEPDADDKGIIVRNVQRYEPVVKADTPPGFEKAAEGLVVPKEGKGPSGLVLANEL